MHGRSKAKLGIVAAALFVAMGAVAACADLPTSVDDPPPVENCIWVGNVLHCHPT